MSHFQVSPLVSSSEDLVAMIVEIRSYAKWFNQYLVSKKAGVTPTDTQPELSTVATETIRDWANKNPLTSAHLDELITHLEATRKQAPTLTITLAAPAPNEVKRSIVEWVRANLSENALVSFRFNSQILGGMIVRVGSRIYDWSFRQTILDNKATLVEVFTRV